MTPYLEVDEAQDYFDTRLNSSAWDDASDTNKYKSLCTATRLINNLDYIGEKAYLDQDNEFPRLGQLDTPDDIKEACCEIAVQLLDGYDPDYEIASIGDIQAHYSSVRSLYNRDFAMDYIRAGIPSAQAWQRLTKYLNNPSKVIIRRV